jgi:hypothetical protein
MTLSNILFKFGIFTLPILVFISYIKNGFPLELERFILNLSYNIIHAFSEIQISFRKMGRTIYSHPQMKYIIDNFCNAYESIHPILDEIEYIKNGEIIDKFILNTTYVQPNDFDFAIISYHNNPDKCAYRKMHYPKEISSSNYELSDIQFMLVEFCLDDECYKMNLNDEKHNYYVVGNIIDFKFAIYYVSKYYSKKLSMEEYETKLKNAYIKIIDQNVNIIKLVANDNGVKLTKDGYEVLQ